MNKSFKIFFISGALLYNLLNKWLKGTVREEDYAGCWDDFMTNEAKTTWWETLSFTGNYDLIKRGV
jgi:hypothetical protein